MLTGKRVLLIIGGGIAAYKCLELIRGLRRAGADVGCVMTKAAHAFVTPLSVAALSEQKVHTALFDLTEEVEMGHIQLSRAADLVVVAPATADLMAKAAGGHADDLATTVLMATDKPVLMAPAMNVRMWLHPATQDNRGLLARRGVGFVGPEEGDMACGEYGPGRMAEPAAILEAISAHLHGERLLTDGHGAPTPGAGFPRPASTEPIITPPPSARPLSGRRAIVTSGPTHEPIDPVRYIANRSSGKQGHAIARALAESGADTVLITGPTQEPDPPGATVIHVETAREMLAACQNRLPADIVICAAAVADWRVEAEAGQKLKKQPDAQPVLRLVENPDILAELAREQADRPALVIGFAAETENVVENAKLKRLKKGCDWVVANDVSDGTGTFGGASNAVHLVLSDTHVDHWPIQSKAAVARKLVDRIIDRFPRPVAEAADAADAGGGSAGADLVRR